MNPSRSGAFGRGVLYVLIAMLVAANTDTWLRDNLPGYAKSAMAIVAVGLLTWRSFIDQSISQARVAMESAPRLDDGSTLDTGGENNGDES